MKRLFRAVAGRFPLWQRRPVRRLVYGLLGLLVVIVYGVAGLLVMGWSLSDAFYMVMISVTTVGFGEVRPLESTAARLHVVSVILLGSISVAYMIGNLVAFITEGEIQSFLGFQRIMRKIEELENHVIVVGYGRMGKLLCADLQAAKVPFVLIDRSPEIVSDLQAHNFLYLIGEATDEGLLRTAGLERASALVTCIPSDAENVFITLTAHDMAPKLLIVARAEQPSTQKKLHQAGARHVVLPAAIGATRIASLLTRPKATEFAELVMQDTSLGFEMDEHLVLAGGVLLGQTLRDADVGRRTGAMVIAIKRRDGQVEFPPQGNERLQAGDSLVLLGRRENLERFREAFPEAI